MKSFAVAICAPSGTGKTTVTQALVQRSDDLVFSVSATTRPARPAEQPGVDYHFVSRDEFEAMIAEGELLEWAEVHGELYGTPRVNLEEAERQEKALILDIDVQGARQVVRARSDTVTIFLLPPSFDTLLERLRNRGSEDEVRLRERLETARRELEHVDSFEYVVVNDRLEETVVRVRSIIDAECRRLDRQVAEVEALQRRLQQDLDRRRS
ncbi:MAG: guanylate kinase [Gemmatimonadota bacterium]|nr:MAG: guanylate kinase [Gemmatimonadota bacterium]